MKMGHQCLLSLREVHLLDRSIHSSSRKEILGIRAYPDLRHVPGDVDLAILVLPASEALAALSACQKKNVRGPLLSRLASGRSRARQGLSFKRKWLRWPTKPESRSSDPIPRNGECSRGPQCFFHSNFFHLKPGPISAISQSGGVAHLIGYQALDEGSGWEIDWIRKSLQCGVRRFAPFLARDQQTRCLVLFIEGLEDPGGSWQPSGILSPKNQLWP